MPTPRGIVALVGAAVALGTGRVLGLLDVFVLGAALAATVVVSAAYVAARRPAVVAARRVQPARVHAGGSSRVELALMNHGTRRSPVLAVRDPFDRGARWARFLVAPLTPGETARAAYRLPTDRRGIFELGPLTVRVSDPFGLAVASVVAAPATRLTVYPKVHAVAPLPDRGGDDPLGGDDHPRGLAGAGEDFFALRPYVRGDDLRRVHWPSTARTDELMIRQDEMPWQGRSTIVVDLRAATTTPDALELVLSAAASIVTAGWRRRSLLRLMTTSGYDSGFAEGRAHIEAILEQLAGADTDNGDLVRTLGRLRRSAASGVAVVTTALAPTGDLDALATLRPGHGGATLVLFERSAWAPSASALPTRPVSPALRLVRVTETVPFSAAWASVFGRPDVATAAAPGGLE